MRKYFGFKTITVLILITGLVYYYGFSGSKTAGSSAKRSGSSYERVSEGTFELLVSCSGVISALSSVDVKSRVGGNVEHLKLMEGDVVKKGELVAQIDRRNVDLKLKQSEADLNSAKISLERAKISYGLDKVSNYNEMQKAMSNIELSRANLQLLKKGSRPEEISQGGAQLDLARANFENSRKNFDRNKELFAKNLISQSALDAARASLDVNEAQVRTAQEKLSLLKQGFQSEEIQKAMSQYEVSVFAVEDIKIKIDSLRLREEEIKNLETTVKKAQITYQDVVEQVNDTTVNAPIDGVITQKWVDEGGIITSGISSVTAGTNIVTISDMSEVWIKANVDETDIHKLVNNLEARVRLDAFPKRTFKASLLSIGPRVYLKDNVPVIDVTLKLLEGTSEVKVGMTADADIIVHSKPDVKMISTDSIIEKDGKFFVKLSGGRSNGSNSGQLREIKIGESNGDKTILLSGIEDKETFLSGEALKDEKASQQKTSAGMPIVGQQPRGGGRH
ncbi:MAG TPA: HlyD family efflux transporter periplasmic adaptor subunit [Candidatus Wallbacteria bacterium]|nr:HlyD family efflux transporter periplasmic adaptor subunit [Candidatus Wallbacteria bacterium]